MTKLLLLSIRSESVRCAVNINGQTAAEASPGQPFCMLLPQERALFTFWPLEEPPGALALPFSRFVCLDPEANGAAGCGDHLSLTFLPDGAASLAVSFPLVALPGALPPHTICSRQFNAGGSALLASVYHDISDNFLLEAPPGRALFAYAFPGAVEDARIEPLYAGGELFVMAQTKGPCAVLLCLRAYPAAFCFCEPCCEYIYENDVLALRRDVGDPLGNLLETRLRQREGTFEKLSSSLVLCRPPLDATPARRLLSFLLAVQYGAEEAALALLSASFSAEICFADLREYFGGDFEVKKESVSERSFVLHYPSFAAGVFTARRFAVSWEGERIGNISEE